MQDIHAGGGGGSKSVSKIVPMSQNTIYIASKGNIFEYFIYNHLPRKKLTNERTFTNLVLGPLDIKLISLIFYKNIQLQK